MGFGPVPLFFLALPFRLQRAEHTEVGFAGVPSNATMELNRGEKPEQRLLDEST
jgi:hypothetical protein